MKNIWRRIIRREGAFLFKRKKSCGFFMFVYPFIIMGLILAIFSGKVLDKIPLGVVDNSSGYYSRELMRTLKSNRFLSPRPFATVAAARKALDQGRIYGVVAVDESYDKDLLKNTGATINAWVNNEYLLVGGNLTKGLNAVIGAMQAKYQRRNLAALGVPSSMGDSFASPLQVSENILYNPGMNYIYFLGLGLLPAVLQLFVCISVCYSLLWDIKTYHAKRFRRIFEDRPYSAAAARIGFYTAGYFAVFTVMLAGIILLFQVPAEGSLFRVMCGGAAFVFMTASTALLFAGCTNNLRFCLSVCAIYAAPAFAFYGVSFPVQSMPILARAWAEFLPGTHLNRIFVNELLRGVNAAGTWQDILFMTAVGTVCFVLGAKGYSRWVKQNKYLGPKL